MVAVPDMDKRTMEDVIDDVAQREAPTVELEVADRMLVCVRVRAHDPSGDGSVPHLPPFRLLISDGESDHTPEGDQRVLLSERSNHSFLEQSVNT
jgi:hypothetical protein